MNSGPDTTRTEPDKGSAEPLSRNMGSHSSLGNHIMFFYAIMLHSKRSIAFKMHV